MKKKILVSKKPVSLTPVRNGAFQVRVPTEINKAMGWKSSAEMRWVVKDGVASLRLAEDVDRALEEVL